MIFWEFISLYQVYPFLFPDFIHTYIFSYPLGSWWLFRAAGLDALAVRKRTGQAVFRMPLYWSHLSLSDE